MDDWQHVESRYLDANEKITQAAIQLSPHVLNTPLGLDKWTVGQIVEHVQHVNAISLERAIYKITNNKGLSPINLSTKFNGFLLIQALHTNLKFKAPKAVSDLATYHTADTLESLFKQNKLLANQLHELWKPELKQVNVFTHPVAGPVHLEAFYRFLHAHITHHQRQISHFIRKQNDC